VTGANGVTPLRGERARAEPARFRLAGSWFEPSAYRCPPGIGARISSPPPKPAPPGLASGLGLASCSAFQPSPEGICIDEVDEGPLAVDFNDWEPLPVSRLELRVAANVDFVEGLAARCQDASSLVAERTARRVVEDDPRYG